MFLNNNQKIKKEKKLRNKIRHNLFNKRKIRTKNKAKILLIIILVLKKQKLYLCIIEIASVTY